MRRLAGGLGGLLVAAGLSVGLGGCGGAATLQASATFSDVSDLVAGAPVQYAKITVGSVEAIALHGDRAVVTMALDQSAGVPADVTAEVTQTSILGQHYVLLVAPSANGPALQDGAVIGRTEFVPGIQQLVQTGAELFGAVNAAQLAEVVDNGAQGFGGQSANLKTLLNDFDSILSGYASRSSEITSVIDNFDQFNSSLAPNAQADAQAVTNLAQTTTILSQQSRQFEQLLQSLNDLAQQGNSLLSTGLGQMEDQIKALAAVAQQLGQHQQDLATILDQLPGHNAALAGVTVNNYAQILEDIIVCGLPGGGSSSNTDSTCAANGTAKGGGT